MSSHHQTCTALQVFKPVGSLPISLRLRRPADDRTRRIQPKSLQEEEAGITPQVLKALRNQAASRDTLAGGILARALAPSLPPLERRLARSCDVRHSASARHSAPRESLAPRREVELRLVEVIGRRRKWRPQRRGARGVVRIARRARRHHAAGGGTVEGAAAAPAMAPATSAVRMPRRLRS